MLFPLVTGFVRDGELARTVNPKKALPREQKGCIFLASPLGECESAWDFDPAAASVLTHV